MDYSANGIRIAKKESVKDLGVFVDNKLNFKAHINFVSNAALLKCRQLLRTFRSTNANLYFKLYSIYVQPILDYGSEVYSPSSIASTKKLEKPLKFFSRRIFQRCNMSYSSYDDRLNQCNLKSVQHRRILQILRTYHNIICGDFHFPDVSSLVRKARSPRFPYLLCVCGTSNKSFLHKYLPLWNSVALLLPVKFSRPAFSTLISSIPLDKLLPHI
nr:hypothetical protein C02E7.14 - Caenorhabditis elegans [Caenorhabditis elegans]